MNPVAADPSPVSRGGKGPEARDPGAAGPLVEALDALQAEWVDRLDRDLTGRMRKTLAEVRDAHRAAMEETGLRPGADGPAPSFDTMRTYRRTIHRAVVQPLLQLANEADPGRRAGALVDRLVEGLVDVAREAPASIRRAAPLDRYRPSEEDGAVRSGLKHLFQGASALTGVLRSGTPKETVPLRGIALSVLQRDDIAESSALTEALYQYHARPLQRIEMALGVWMRDWIPLETELHEPEAHLAPEDRERLARLREELKRATVDSGTEPPPEGEAPASGPAQDPEPTETDGTAPGPDAAQESGPPAAPTPASVAATFQKVLDEVAQLPPPEAVLADLGKRFDRLRQRLEDRVREGGTPFARVAEASPRRLKRARKRREERLEAWREWFDASIDRLRLTDEYLALRADGGNIFADLLHRTLQDSVLFLADRIDASQKGLLGLRDRAPEPDEDADEDDPEVAEALASDTWSIEEEARELLEKELLEPLRALNPRVRVEKTASESVEALSDRLSGLPRTVSVHPIRPPEEVVDPRQPIRTIPLREIARQGLDVLHLEGLRTTPAPLIDYLTQVEGQCQQVVEMVAYSLSSAREALQGGAGKGPEAQEPEDLDAPPPVEPDEADDPVDAGKTGVQAAQTLSQEGLARAADSLEVILAPGIEAWDEFAEAAHDTLKEAREQLYARLVVEGTVQEQIRDVRSLIRSWWRGNVDRARAFQKEYGPPLKRRIVRAYIHGLRLFRRGRLAMGGADTRRTELAAEVLGRIPTLLEPLPLIYRRLYSFQPLTEPGLMVGRESDRGWLASQYSRWTEGSCPPVVLTGAMAVGHTSFLNVVAQELPTKDGEVPVTRIVPSTRYLEEAAVAARLARGFWGDEADGLLRPPGAEPAGGEDEAATPPSWSFARVGQLLRERNEQRIVLLERLEHFLIRVPGGCSLAERFLAFQSRTAAQVFWVNSISDPAWKLLTTTEPHTPGLVQIRRLEAPDRRTMEEILLVRHRRSGVPLEFVEPSEINPLVRRKLKRARTEKARQAVLQADFFDWLYRASQGSVLMGILMWLRSADFTSRPGWLRMSPSRAIRFAFLEEMDLPTSFALKAFLEHESLTLEEYSRIFSVSSEEAFQTLEVLRRKVLIDRLDTPGSLPVPVRRLEEGVRYRIPPIITQVIAQNLRGQNILH